MTGFILYCVIVYSVISAIFGVTSLASTGFISWQDYQNVWLTWAIGDAMGVLIISPLLLTIGRWTKDVWPKEKTTNLMVYLVVFSISMFLFMQSSPSESIEVSQFFILPLLLWPAFRSAVFCAFG